MSNYIINGDFSDGFSAWNNGVGGGESFILDSGKAQAPGIGGSEVTYIMEQEFNVNNEIVSAKITVWGQWLARSGDVSDGYNRFIVELIKPNMGVATLLDITKGVAESDGYLLNDLDIASEFDQYGNYRLYLLIKTVAAISLVGGKPVINPSYGWYDNINVNIAVKKYKSIIESISPIGSMVGFDYEITKTDTISLVEALKNLAKISPSENISLIEQYDLLAELSINLQEAITLLESISTKADFTKTISENIALNEFFTIISERFDILEVLSLSEDFSIDTLFRKALSDTISLLEAYSLNLSKIIAEPLWLTGSITRKISRAIAESVSLSGTLNAILGASRTIEESMALLEATTAKRIQGNLETTYTIGDLTQWSEVSPTVTPWIKTKIIT